MAEQEQFGAIGKARADRAKEIEVAQNVAASDKGKKQAEQDRRVYVSEQEAIAVGGENSARADIAS